MIAGACPWCLKPLLLDENDEEYCECQAYQDYIEMEEDKNGT